MNNIISSLYDFTSRSDTKSYMVYVAANNTESRQKEKLNRHTAHDIKGINPFQDMGFAFSKAFIFVAEYLFTYFYFSLSTLFLLTVFRHYFSFSFLMTKSGSPIANYDVCKSAVSYLTGI